MSKHTPEITEQDRKAIEEYLYKIDIDDFDTVYCKMAAEWGILHARANDDPGPDWVASNILEGAAKRIAELEAANAKLMDEFDKNITTLGQYLFYPHPKELMAEIERLKSSPVSVDIKNYICVNCKVVTNHKQSRCIQCGCQTHEPTAAEVTYPADTRHEDIDRGNLLLEKALGFIHEYGNSGIQSRVVRKAVYDFETELKKHLAALSRAQKPDTKQ